MSVLLRRSTARLFSTSSMTSSRERTASAPALTLGGEGMVNCTDPTASGSVRRLRLPLEALCSHSIAAEGEAQRVLLGARTHPDIPQRCPHDPGRATEP